MFSLFFQSCNSAPLLKLEILNLQPQYDPPPFSLLLVSSLLPIPNSSVSLSHFFLLTLSLSTVILVLAPTNFFPLSTSPFPRS